MVWGLFPAESLPGEQKYFIFSTGTYKVGRKGCEVVINTDKGVSRIHAELVVNGMTSSNPEKKSTRFSSEVRIKDCSKYGTFINKKMGSKAKVHEHPNKDAILKDGDLLSFGTGNATYRFCFVPFIFFICCSEPSQVNRPLKDKISLMGACISHKWDAECTHMLVDGQTLIKDDLIDAIVAQKPVLLSNWVEVLAEKNIRTEIPSYSSYVPTMTWEGVSINIVDPKVRENCLAGYTFLLGSSHLYKFGERLLLLLCVGGGKILPIDEFCSSSQATEDGGNDQTVLVLPAGSGNEFDHYHHLRSLSRVNDVNLISAVLSGRLDPSFVVSQSVLVSSSCSTDETMVADSDVEVNMTSECAAAAAQSEETFKQEEKEISGNPTISEKMHIPDLKVEDGGGFAGRDKGDDYETSGNQNSNIIYSQDLIVRDTNISASLTPTANNTVVNFKRFRKRETPSGNSFKDLIPFSKYPYQDSNYGSEEVTGYLKEEKKRKQMEAIAEDLFNNEKAKRGVSSLRRLLTRG